MARITVLRGARHGRPCTCRARCASSKLSRASGSFSALCTSYRCAMKLERRCACLLSSLYSAASIEMSASAAMSRASCACNNRYKENAPRSPMRTRTALVSAVRFISISSWPRFCGGSLYPFRQSFTALAAAEVSFLSQLCRRGDSVRNAGFSDLARPEIRLNGTSSRSIKNFEIGHIFGPYLFGRGSVEKRQASI